MNNPQDYLMHYGHLGMKWGQRNGPPYPLNYDKLSRSEKRKLPKWVKKLRKGKYDEVVNKNGVTILREAPGMLNKKHSETNKSYHIVVNDKYVGEAYLFVQDKLTTNIEWLHIKESERGKKYAQTVMDWIIESQTKDGKERLTLEVPGKAKDARHIYDKKGFKATGSIDNGENDIWGGLTMMEKKLKQKGPSSNE